MTALWTPIRLIPRNLATSAAGCPTSSTASQANRENIFDTDSTGYTDYTFSRLAAKEIEILEMDVDVAPLPWLHRIVA